MNRIDTVLEKIAQKNHKLLIPYITAGDPSLTATIDIMHRLVEAGADILEIGMPFSDPMAEGPVIQAAMERALQQGMDCGKVFDIIEQFRQRDQKTPIVLMGYVNPVEIFGYERFARKAQAVGIDGTILVDMPPEESQEMRQHWQAHGLYPIFLCSPTTSDRRMQLINQFGKGFIYYVSLKGVTGSHQLDLENVRQNYAYTKSHLQLPLMVGFGIKTPSQAASLAQFADGIVVGAALIETMHDAYIKQVDFMTPGANFLHSLRQALNQG